MGLRLKTLITIALTYFFLMACLLVATACSSTARPTPTPGPGKEYHAGVTAQLSGKYWEAYQQFEKVIAMNPGYRDIGPRMYAVYQRLHDPIHIVSDETHWKTSQKKNTGWNSDPKYDASDWVLPVSGELAYDVPRLADSSVKYIWAPDATGWDTEVYFRRVITLDKAPVSAKVEMNVDHEYDFYDNGHLAGSDHRSDGWQYAEYYSIVKYLHPGKNVLAVDAQKAWGDESFAFSLNIQQLGTPDHTVASFLASYSTPTPTFTDTSTPTQTATVTPTLTNTATPTITPTSTPTPNVGLLESQLGTAWGKGDWPMAIQILQALRKAVPGSKEYSDKLYSAYFNFGKQLYAKGDKTGAASQWEKADTLDPSNGVARAAIVALTPTATPVPPTATPTPGYTNADQRYIIKVGIQMLVAQQQITDIGNLSSQVNNDPSIIFDPNWRSQLVGDCRSLSSTGDALRSISPVPPHMGTLNGYLVDMGNQIVAMCNDFIPGVNSMNVNLLQAAVNHMDNINADVSKVTGELNKLNAEYAR